MTVKLFEFTKCLCCISLKPGLLIWGYSKLIFSILSIMSFVAMMAGVPVSSAGLLGWLFLLYATSTLLSEAAFSIVIIVAIHKNNVRLLRIAYVYYIVWICLSILNLIWQLYNDFDLYYEYPGTPNNKYILSVGMARFLILVLHGYVTCLIRHKINIMQNEEPEQVTHKMTEQKHSFYSIVQITPENAISTLESEKKYIIDIKC